ncbi:MAG: hypothetical protein ACRDRM_09420, partial [Pseudonocardiaceae bacterium]
PSIERPSARQLSAADRSRCPVTEREDRVRAAQSLDEERTNVMACILDDSLASVRVRDLTPRLWAWQ